MKKKTYTPPMTEAVEMEPCVMMADSKKDPGTEGPKDPDTAADEPDFEGPTI